MRTVYTLQSDQYGGRGFWYRTKSSTWTCRDSDKCTPLMALSSMFSFFCFRQDLLQIIADAVVWTFTRLRGPIHQTKSLYIFLTNGAWVWKRWESKPNSTRDYYYSYFLLDHFFRLLNILEDKKIQRGVIVFPGNMTPSARKVMSFGCFIFLPASIAVNRLLLLWL